MNHIGDGEYDGEKKIGYFVPPQQKIAHLILLLFAWG